MPLARKAAETVAKLRESIAMRARAVPLARHAWARYRRQRYEQRIEGFLRAKDGRADRLPLGGGAERRFEGVLYDVLAHVLACGFLVSTFASRIRAPSFNSRIA